MHKLMRPDNIPVGLKRAVEEAWDNWEQLQGEEKQELQCVLLVMQSNRCAYCECSLNMGEGHIEHFRRKNKDFYPELMFDWNNLYYSCMRNGSCGSHKDRVLVKDNVDWLLDPCKDNPEDFLLFAIDGKVYPRDGLSEKDLRRANLTIDTFGLNNAKLVEERLGILNGYQWLKNCEESTLDEVLDALKEDTPYITQLYHSLGRRFVA